MNMIFLASLITTNSRL